ncbi:MAG: HAD-IIB family hydrolase [Thermodesulfobacteriota bacterium]|nr:HAD-IIB family hydrolase [Thermodesulfobacteriota bacterium]
MKIKYLLASDMDGTVIPLDDRVERSREIEEFRSLIDQHKDVVLAYVTGRHFELGMKGIKEFNLPGPEIFVCDVGTTIYRQIGGAWRLDEEFRKGLKKSWKGRTGKDIAYLIHDIPELTEQEREKQTEFKQSYYIAVDAKTNRVVRSIQDMLAEDKIEAEIIYSVDTKKNIGLLDLLPKAAAKGTALKYLWNGLEILKDNVVYAGDSGNDLNAFISGFNAVVVNNTPENVKNEVRKQIRMMNIKDRVFFADSKYVKGVIEGCFHFNLFRSHYNE